MKKRYDGYLAYISEHYPEKSVPEIAQLYNENEDAEVSLSTIERDLYRVTSEMEEQEATQESKGTPEEGSGSEDPDWTWGKESSVPPTMDPGMEEPPEQAIGLTEIKRSYFYNKEDDVYIVFLRGRKKNIQVDGKTVREMKTAYSDHVDKGETINKVCHRFGWRREDFIDFKVALGWTHDEDPFTDEEHVLRSTPDLVSDMAMQQRGVFEREWNRKKWKLTVEDAHKWRNFNRGVIEPLFDHVSHHPPRKDVQKLDLPQKHFLAVFAPQDLHIDKLNVDGTGIKETREHLLETTSRLISQITKRGRPERVQLILGSDWWNSDNDHAQTHSGTPQDNDGLPLTGLIAGYELQIELIDMLRCLGHVEVRVVPGNHDWRTSQVAWCGLRHGYSKDDDVSIVNTILPYQYDQFGDVAIGFHHGHGIRGSRSSRPLKYGMMMAKHRPDLWGSTRFRYWIVGHLHGIDEVDDGITILQTPSLAGDDRWHYLNGYTTRDRGQAAYIFDRDFGLVSRELALIR